MASEPQPYEQESEEPRQPESNTADDANPPAPAIIPGNVGSLDDVPPDVLEEGAPTGDDEGR